MTPTIKNHLEKRLSHYEGESHSYKIAEVLNQFEVFLGGLLELYESIKEFDRGWRLSVFRGIVEFSGDDHRDIRNLYQRWVNICQAVEKPLRFFEDEGFAGGVAGTEEFRAALNEAQKTLAANESPRLSAAVGLRRIKLDAEGSRMIREMLKS